MRRLLALIGHPERHLPPVVHVAGTNGKGSVIAFLRSILEGAGYRVHVYTSPHLVRFNERIRLVDGLIGDEDLIAYADGMGKRRVFAPVPVFACRKEVISGHWDQTEVARLR